MDRAHCLDEGTLLALVDGTLPPDQRASVDEHLSSCDACLQLVASMLGDEPEPGAPDAEVRRIGRYLVLAPIAAGAMGIVYAAFDPELHRKVALKLLHLQGEGSGERILHEARAMARLSHPNVVAIHDVGTWREQVFIAMELVEGATLASWLAKQPRSWREIVQLFLMAGRGLAAAHAAGLVHRDFKPENVLVGTDGRARVTDFGLARAGFVAPDPSAAVTVGPTISAVAGSPGYMAPEVIRGQAPSVRSDVFGFCVSLHECLYGTRPFTGKSLEELLGSIEHAAPQEPVARRRVPAFLRRIIWRGLRPAPEERFESMEALLDALERDPLKRAGLPLAAVALAGLAAAGAFLLRARPAGTQARPSIALVEPAVRPEGSEWLGPAAGELLSAELALDPHLRVLPAESVSSALRDLHLSPGPLTRETAQALGARLGADAIVSGRIDTAEHLSLALEVLEGASGETRATLTASGDGRRLTPLASEVGPRLRRAVGGRGSIDAAPARSSFPSSPEAAQLYARALREMSAYEPAHARDTLERAAAIEPDSARIQGTLAEAYLLLAYNEKARDAATRAFQRADSLSPDERVRIEGLYRRSIGDMAGALALAQKRWRLAPDDAEVGLELATAYHREAREEEALAQLTDLRRLPEPQSADPRIGLLQATVLNIQGNGKMGLEAASKAGARAIALGARGLVGRANYLEAQALALQGDRIGAISVYSQSERIFRDLGDLPDAAKASMMIGTNLADLGDLEAARLRFISARRLFHEVDDRFAEASASGNLAVLLRRTRRHMPEALELARETRTAMMEMGNLARAERAHALVAQIEMDLGDLAGARADYEETIRNMRADKLGWVDHMLLELAEVEVRQGAFADARRTLAEAMALPKREKYTPAVHDVLMAKLALEEGHPAEAERLARSAIAQAALFERPEQEGGAHVVLALALLARGKPAEARAAATAAAALIKPGSELAPSLALAQARAMAAEHPEQLAQALTAVDAVIAEARKSEIVADLLESQLALCALEKQGRQPGTRARTLALAGEARQRGHRAIAARADVLAR